MRPLSGSGLAVRGSSLVRPDVPTGRELAPNPEMLSLIEFAEIPFFMSLPFVAPPGVPADRDHRVFYAAGADVRRITYPTARLGPEVLKDVNRWVINQVNSEHDVLVRAAR